MQYISDLHSKFALRPHHVWKYGKQLNIQSATAEIRRGEEDEEERRNHRAKNIMSASATQGVHNEKKSRTALKTEP